MEWKIDYCVAHSGKHGIEKWLDALSGEAFRSVFKEITILHLMGNALGLPHCRLLGKKLFELRERRYGYRIYYGFLDEHIILLLVAGNKKRSNKIFCWRVNVWQSIKRGSGS